MRVLMCVLLVVALAFAGCGDDDDDAVTATTASSGSDEVAATEGADFDVAFDGEACTLTGPDSVPSGEYTFVLTDTSGIEGIDAYVDAYTDGHTYADVVNDLEEAGGDGTWVDRSDWSPPALRSFGGPTLDLGEDQTQYDHALEAGPHGIVVVGLGAGVWGCGGFDVT